MLEMKIQMLVATRPNMFTVAEHPLQFMGMVAIETAFRSGQPISGELVSYYPERFLNVQQQQNLIPLLEKLGCPKFSVVTGSPLLIQCAHKDSIRIPCGEDDEPIGNSVMCEQDYMNIDFDAVFNPPD